MSGTEEIQQPKYVDFGDYILFQVRRTQNLIRQTDLMLLVATVVSAILFILLGFILLDHWAFSQGLSRPLRWLGFWGITGSLLGAIIYYWRTTAGKTVTQLFAARTLEKADPSFENNLLTLVDLESNNVETSELIKNSLEKRAALTLNDLDVEHAVDRKALLHRLYALLIGTVLIFGYTFLTPKSVTASMWRILFPWTTTTAPTTTRIFDVEPGSITVTQGSHVEVSAYIDGKIPEAIWLIYSTEDRSVLDERIQLQETDDGLGKYVGLITGENGKGVDQPISYYLLAGDGRTENYKISVRPAPQTSIREIRITPPGYTKRAERTQQSGSLDAIEGSAIQLVAESNMPIKKSWIQLYDSEDPSSRSGQLPLTIKNETEIIGNWTLRFRDDGTYPRFFRIECETADKSRDPSPPLHAILIRPDERPEVRLIDPTSDLVRPINVTVPLLIEAFDPDFRLSGLSVQIEKQGKIIASELIDAKNRQSLTTRYPLELKRLPIQPGDEISFWVEARDNREPYPNRRNTSKLRIRITAPVDQQQAKKQEQEDEQRQKELEQENQPEQDQNAAENPEEKNNEEQAGEENSEDSEQSMKDASQDGESPEKGKTPGEKSEQNKEGEMNQSGDDKNKKKNSGQGENQDQKQGSDPQKKKTDKPKYSPDGEDDDRVLEKMIKKLREKQEKEKQNSKEQNQDNQNQDGEKPEGDQSKQPNPNKNTPDDKTMSEEGTGPNEKAPEKPKENPSEEKNSQNNPSEKNSGEKMKEKEQGNSPDKNEQGEEGSEKKPGEKNEEMKSGEKENSSDKGEKAKQDQQGEKGESQEGEMSSEKQKGESPGDKKSDKPSGETKPGPGDMPDPNGKETGKEPRKPKPDEKTEGEKKPAKKSGEGEAKPGKGDEKGPTEKEKSNGEKPPTSQNQQPPSDEMKKSGKPGESSEQNPEKSSKPGDDSSSSSKKGGKSSQSKSGKSGEKPSSKQGKEGDKSSQKNKQGNPKPSESDSKTNENDKPSSQKNPSEMKPKTGEQTNEKPNQKPSSEKAPEQSKKEGEQNNKQGKNGGDKKGGDKKGGDKSGKGKGKGEGKGGDKPGKEGGKGKGAGKASPGGNKSKGEGISGEMGDAPESDEPGNAKGGQGKQGQPSQAPASETGEEARNQPSEQSLEDRKKAAELVLKELEDELKRGKVDSELLDELGWDKDNLKQFQQRLADYLRHQKDEGKPNLKEKQFEEMLKNMRLTGKRKSRSGNESGTASPDEFAPVMIPAPPEYREVGQAFKKSLSESKNKKP